MEGTLFILRENKRKMYVVTFLYIFRNNVTIVIQDNRHQLSSHARIVSAPCYLTGQAQFVVVVLFRQSSKET